MLIQRSHLNAVEIVLVLQKLLFLLEHLWYLSLGIGELLFNDLRVDSMQVRRDLVDGVLGILFERLYQVQHIKWRLRCAATLVHRHITTRRMRLRVWVWLHQSGPRVATIWRCQIQVGRDVLLVFYFQLAHVEQLLLLFLKLLEVLVFLPGHHFRSLTKKCVLSHLACCFFSLSCELRIPFWFP